MAHDIHSYRIFPQGFRQAGLELRLLCENQRISTGMPQDIYRARAQRYRGELSWGRQHAQVPCMYVVIEADDDRLTRINHQIRDVKTTPFYSAALTLLFPQSPCV